MHCTQTIPISVETLIHQFSNLSTWQERYRELILLAKQLPSFPELKKTDENQILGCENKVWLTYVIDDTNEGKTITYSGDSEGRVIKGILTIILIAISGKTASQIKGFDFIALFNQLGLLNGLGQTKQLGIENIVKAIKEPL